MKTIKIYIFIILILLGYSCSKDSTGPSNKNPNSPSNPIPADNATNVSITSILTWSCSDPENDSLNYDVYFGTYANPPLVNTAQTSNTYDPGTLNYETTYYWNIVAKDDNSNSTTGTVWHFTTRPSGGGGDFEWCDVLAGEYTFGEGDTIKTIDYDYHIMKNEVTNQQYVGYLIEALANGDITITTTTVEGYYPGDEHWIAGNYEFLDLDAGSCCINWTGIEFTIDSVYIEHPVVEVTWFGAYAFAEHYGLRLPLEHEWEKAARGNTGWNYPWGDYIDGSRANYWSSGDPWDNGTTPVGFYNGQNYQGFQTTDSPSPFGAYDMAGNVWDWTDSFYGDSRIIRGGSWFNPCDDIHSWGFEPPVSTYPYNSQFYLGFRCCRTQ